MLCRNILHEPQNERFPEREWAIELSDLPGEKWKKSSRRLPGRSRHLRDRGCCWDWRVELAADIVRSELKLERYWSTWSHRCYPHVLELSSGKGREEFGEQVGSAQGADYLEIKNSVTFR
jgi:hypothetical protein